MINVMQCLLLIKAASKILAHSNLTSTENYLADFEIEEKRKWAASLTEF